MSSSIDYHSLIKNIENGTLNAPVYLFYGPEQFLAKEALRMMTDHYLSPEAMDMNFMKLDARELEAQDLLQELNTLPFFSEYRVLVVEHAEKYFAATKKRSQEEEEILADYMENINEACCLIFSMEVKPDSRKKIFKKIKEKGLAVEFEALKGAQLSSWLRGRVERMDRRIKNDALNYLIAYTGNDLAVLEHELQKLCLFEPEAQEISLEMVRMTISKTAAAGIFDLVDAVGEKKVAKAIDILREMLVAGEAPVYIVFMLARQYRLILSVKSLLRERVPEKQMLSQLSLHPYDFRKVLGQSKNFKEEDLTRGLKHLLEADVGLKNSYADPGYLLEMAVMKISN